MLFVDVGLSGITSLGVVNTSELILGGIKGFDNAKEVGVECDLGEGQRLDAAAFARFAIGIDAALPPAFVPFPIFLFENSGSRPRRRS